MENIAQIGHNNPPDEIEIIKKRLESYKDIPESYERLQAVEIPVEILDAEQAGKISDHIAAIGILEKRIETVFKTEKQPYWDAGKAADAWKTTKVNMLTPLVSLASKPLMAWNKKLEAEEKARQLEIAAKAKEEADKLIEQAHAHANEGIDDTAQDLLEAAVQADTKADMITNSAFDYSARSRGGYSSSAIKRPWVAKVESLAAVDLEIIRHYFKIEEIEAVANRAVKNGVREIRGVKIYQDEQLSTRRR